MKTQPKKPFLQDWSEVILMMTDLTTVASITVGTVMIAWGHWVLGGGGGLLGFFISTVVSEKIIQDGYLSDIKHDQ